MWHFTRPEPVAVAVAAVDRGRVEATVANTRAGTVHACRRARMAPPVGGQIARLPVREGTRVRAGQVLLELWNDDLSAAVTLAQNQAAAARAREEEACSLAGLADREAARQGRLRAQGVVSEEAADRAAAEAVARRAGCRAAEAQVRVAVAQEAVAEANRERTRLRAPFAGTVAELNGEVGEFVTPSPVGIPTPPTVDLVDASCLYVTAPIDEVDAPAVRPGLPARVSLDAFPGRAVPGRVRRVAPYVLDLEKQARTVEVEVELLEPGKLAGLLPGQSADAEIVLATREDALRVPTEAVLEGNRVLVLTPREGGHVLAERVIARGVASWEFTEVTGGLAEGDRVVVSVDRAGVVPGASVTVEAPPAARP